MRYRPDCLHYTVIIMLCPTVFGLIAKITSKCILSVRLYKCKNASRKSRIYTSILQLSSCHHTRTLFLSARARAAHAYIHTRAPSFLPFSPTHIPFLALFFSLSHSFVFFLTNLIKCTLMRTDAN